MHTQHVKFSTYVLGGSGEDVVVDAVTDSLTTSSSFSFGGNGDEAAVASAVDVVVAPVVSVWKSMLILLLISGGNLNFRSFGFF